MNWLVLAMLALSCGCASMPQRAALDAAVAAAMAKQFELETSAVFVRDTKSCNSAPLPNVASVSVESLDGSTFRALHPQGVFALCDVVESGSTAKATIQGINYHKSLDRFLVSFDGVIILEKTGRGWRVTGCDCRWIDY